MSLRHSASTLIEGFLGQTKEYGLICMDAHGIIVEWLGAADAIFGYTAQEAVGTPVQRLFTSEDRALGLDRHELEVARRDSRSEDDRWHVRKDGTRIWVSGSVDAIRDGEGAVVGFIKVGRDRTDLRTEIDRLENQLTAANAAAQRTQLFLRTLGHEMRNPLAPLQMSAHILQKTSTDPRAAKAVDIIFAQLGALTRLADDLMDAARLDVGKVELQLERQDLCPLIHDAVLGQRLEAERKGLRLAALLPDAPLLVDLDSQRFQQVLLNLLGNAIKYTPAGGSVWLKATQEASHVVLRVEDTGMGIDPEMLPRIFDLFSRDKDAAAAEPGGLGIGLAVVREVMELHQGSVQARSGGRGKGSEFTVRLPAAAPGPDHP